MLVRNLAIAASLWALAPLAGCGAPDASTSIPARSASHTVPPPLFRWKETVLHSFNYTDGAYNLSSGLVFDAAGNLYGTTPSGGIYGCDTLGSCGVAFELVRGADGKWTENVLHSFSPGDSLGFFPRAGLILDARGNLYGTTDSGGRFCSASVSCGTVFELSPSSGQWTAKAIYAFRAGSDGSNPQAALTFDAVGNLYGTTSEGGDSADGTIFELTPQTNGSWIKRTLHSFTTAEGAGPQSPMVLDRAGNLYGTADFGGARRSACGGYGCGTAFELSPAKKGVWTLKVLHSFGNGKDGAYPVSGLTMDSAGNLFGVTSQGGARSSACFAYGCGTAYELTRENSNNWTERVIHDFGSGSGGNLPRGNLVVDETGALYGGAVFGGSYNDGIAFRLIQSGDRWKETVLHTFGRGKDGVNPESGMIFDQNGNLYGATAYGGTYRAGACNTSHGCGTIFTIMPPAPAK
jgi:uncharacterized repeat protein (TIGR03803 family)